MPAANTLMKVTSSVPPAFVDLLEQHAGIIRQVAAGYSSSVAARGLFLIKQMDYAAPVLPLQRQIAELRRWHVRAGLWFGSASCFIWIPLTLMLFYALGADVWVRTPSVVVWFLVSGVVCLGVVLGIIFWSRRAGREKLARNLQDSSAGHSLNRAQELLDEIDRFENE